MYYESMLILLDKSMLHEYILKKARLFVLTGTESGKPQDIKFISKDDAINNPLYTFEICYVFNKTTQFKLTSNEILRAVYTKKTLYQFN